MKQLIALFALMMILFGACSFSGNGYKAEVGGAFADAARIGAQREAAHQAGETERLRIATNGEIEQAQSQERLASTVAPWTALMIVAICMMLVGISWSRRPHRPVPPRIVMLAAPHLAADTSRYLADVDGEWCVVDDERRELIPVERRLN